MLLEFCLICTDPHSGETGSGPLYPEKVCGEVRRYGPAQRREQLEPGRSGDGLQPTKYTGMRKARSQG